jgi:uncharacterized protein (TIRG00374 family)
LHAIWQTVATSAQRLSTARPAYAAAALALYAVSLVLAGARWRGFLRALGAEAGVTRATLATLGGIAAGNLTPPPGGEACRIALLRAGGRATWQQATVAAIWDRLSELPPILVLGAMTMIAVRSFAAQWRTHRVLAGAIGLALVGVGVWRGRRAGGRWTAWRARLAQHRVSRRVFAEGVAYSSLLWLQDFLRLTCGGAVARTIIRGAEIRAAFDDPRRRLPGRNAHLQ